MMSESAKLAYKELEILARDARAALLDFGHTDEEITKASRGQMDGVTIPLADDRDQTTDQWRWLESLSAATRGMKANKSGEYDRAEKEQANAEKWAIKARTASHVNRGYDVLQGTKDAGRSTAAKYRTQWPEYQRFIDEMHEQNPRLTYADLQRKAAAHFDCSTKTIQRNTDNPLK